MAKKARTPAPPKRVQAPQRRTEPRDPARTRMWIAAIAGVLILAGIIGGAVLAFGGSDEPAGTAAAGDVCQIQTVESQGQGHVTELPDDFEPNSFPRTSGPHHPSTLVFDQYRDPIPQLNLVHNLEHGGVAVQYGSEISDATIDQLTAWYRSDPNGLIIAPLPDVAQAEPLADKITLAAWVAEREDPEDPFSEVTKQEGKLAVCSGFDEDEFNDFLSNYRATGPELFELEQLAPGSQ